MELISIATVISLGLTFVMDPTTAIGNSPTFLFEMFLETKLNTFPAWIRSNNLDPSPVNPSQLLLFTTTSLPRYTLKIKNEQISGYASASNNLSTLVEVDLKRQFFYVTHSTKGSLKFHGHYSINGTNSFPERPLIGEGAWTYAINGTLNEDFTYRFKVQPNGYLEISQDLEKYSALLIGDPGEHKEVKLEGYLEEDADLIEYEKERIRAKFQKAFEDQRIQNSYPEHPTAKLVHQYLTDVFESTHYSEIINDPGFTTTSSSTTEKAKTEEIPTNETTPSPTDEPLHGQCSHFRMSSGILFMALILVLLFQ